MADSTLTYRLLGYGGLVPFFVPAILIVAGIGPLGTLLWLVNAYSFGIVCFLTGSWWGMALGANRWRALVMSNLYFLVAAGVFVFVPTWWPVVAAVLLIALYFAERDNNLLPPQDPAYRRLRLHLTVVASLSMFAVQFAL